MFCQQIGTRGFVWDLKCLYTATLIFDQDSSFINSQLSDLHVECSPSFHKPRVPCQCASQFTLPSPLYPPSSFSFPFQCIGTARLLIMKIHFQTSNINELFYAVGMASAFKEQARQKEKLEEALQNVRKGEFFISLFPYLSIRH